MQSSKHTPGVASAALALVWAFSSLTPALAVSASPDAMVESRRWVAAAFEGTVAPVPAPGLEVLSNYDLVQKKARFGKPLKLAGTEYPQGLFCHANSQIVVRLPSPGKTFQAVVGVDSNEQTVGGRGSVVFAVQVAGNDAFRSAILKEGMPAVPVKVDLAGAIEFILEVNDSGDGLACDQADWADAQITLADGQNIWLTDLPVAGGPAVADLESPVFSFVYDGRPSAELLKDWKLERSTKTLDPQRTERTLTYTDPKTGLDFFQDGCGGRAWIREIHGPFHRGEIVVLDGNDTDNPVSYTHLRRRRCTGCC